MSRRTSSISRSQQRGAVLIVSMILLLILTLIGITAARLQTVQEGMARNETNHQLAMQAAEAALRDAETTLWDGIYTTSDFAANNNGLYQLRSEISSGTFSSVADTIDWNNPGTQTRAYSGPGLADAPTPPTAAQIIIEDLPPVARPGDPICGAGYGQQQACSAYRITAHASGGDATSNATLQSIFH